MFIYNRMIRSFIILACAAAIIAHPAAWTAQAPSKNANTMVDLRFTNADMYDFANRMAELLGYRPIMVDPAVQGTVDINTPIPHDDLFDLFIGILRTRNAVLVRQNGIYQVVPLSLAGRYNLEIIDYPTMPDAVAPGTEIVPVLPVPKLERGPEDSMTIPIATYAIRLDFVPVEDIVEAVRVFLPEGAPIMTFKRLNMIIITDYSDNVARIREFVRMLDNSFFNSDFVDLVQVEYRNAVDVTDELKKIFGSSAVENAATGVSFVPLERINAIFVMAGTKRGFDEARRWIEELDTYDGNKFQTFTYTVQNSSASSIAAMLAALYGGTSSGTGSSTTGSTQGTSSLLGGIGGTLGSAQQLGPRLNTSSATVQSVVLGGGDSSSLRDEARVVVDSINNQLLILATPADHRFLLNAIERMDALPRQVQINVEVYEVNHTDDLAYGISGILEARGEGNITTADFDATTGVGSIRTFANIGDVRQLQLALGALSIQNRVRSRAVPSLTVMDGSEASFVSGAEIPYPGQTIITGNSLGSTSVNYRETGITLQVVPTISASGLVRMAITQEISTPSGSTGGEMSAPIFLKSTVSTELSVMDGQTAALAGMLRDTDTWGRAGIPLLSKIPFIGGLFGGTTRNNNRTEVIILITPRVIRTPEKFEEITRGMLDSLRNISRLTDEHERNRIRDIEDSRQNRERREQSNIREVRPAQ